MKKNLANLNFLPRLQLKLCSEKIGVSEFRKLGLNLFSELNFYALWHFLRVIFSSQAMEAVKFDTVVRISFFLIEDKQSPSSGVSKLPRLQRNRALEKSEPAAVSKLMRLDC